MKKIISICALLFGAIMLLSETAEAGPEISGKSKYERRVFMDATQKKMAAIAKQSKDTNALRAVSFLKETIRLAYPTINGISYLTPVPQNGTYIGYVPVMDEDTSLVYSWNLLPFEITGPTFVAIGSEKALIVTQPTGSPLYYVRLFDGAFKAYLSYQHPYNYEGTVAASIERYETTRLDGTLLYQLSNAKYRSAFDASVLRLAAYARKHSNDSSVLFPGKIYVIAACGKLGQSSGSDDAKYRMKIVYLSACYKAIDMLGYDEEKTKAIKVMVTSKYQ